MLKFRKASVKPRTDVTVEFALDLARDASKVFGYSTPQVQRVIIHATKLQAFCADPAKRDLGVTTRSQEIMDSVQYERLVFGECWSPTMEQVRWAEELLVEFELAQMFVR